jgi:aspartate kinase
MIIMKFGGTSVADATAMSRTISIVESKLSQRPIMVVSACAKVTDSLYQIIKDAEAGDKCAAEEIIVALQKRHLGIVDDFISELNVNEGEKDVKDKINSIFAVIRTLVDEYCGKEMHAPQKALLISSGEYLSSTIIAYAMNLRGTKTNWIDARKFMVTNDNHLKASPISSEIEARAAGVINQAYKDMDAVITQGFIAATLEGEPTLLGRGGSDYSASLIGMAVDADRIEIWTDVDGVRTADPRIVPNTKGLRKLSYEEAAEMARFGAKVLHPLTLEPAQYKNIPVYVLNSMNPQGEGTAVLNQACIFDGIKSIAYKENIRVISIYSMKMIETYGFMERVFEIFSRYGVSVDLLSSSEASITVTVDAAQDISKVVEELSKLCDVKIDRDKSQISIIGKNIIGIKGILADTFNATIDSKIYMVSQGATFLNLSFVVDRPEMAEILKTLHKTFFERDEVIG